MTKALLSPTEGQRVVYLNRIYTKTGDAGETSLGDGTRVSKTDQRIIAYGTVDELNAVIGLALTEIDEAATFALLQSIQNDLFDLGADLCVPESAASPDDAANATPSLRTTEEQVKALELSIDYATAGLKPLTSFILPGGTRDAANLHHARTVCRRAEIEVRKLAERDAINPQASIYLNRLSDLLFVLARVANNNGESDVLWQPGGVRNAKWAVWRQDDNANTFLVAGGLEKSQADAMVAEFESKHHKQTYWVKREKEEA